MSIEAAFVERMICTAHRSEIALARWLRTNRLTLLEGRVLRHFLFAHLDDRSCIGNDIAKTMGISRPAAMNVVERLDRRRFVFFVDMSDAKDRRAKALRPTEEGVTMGILVDHLMLDLGRELLALFDLTQRRHVLEQLGTVSERARRVQRLRLDELSELRRAHQSDP